jgi:hypothetical protein
MLHHRDHAVERDLFGTSLGMVTAQSFHLNYGNCILPTMKRTVRTYQHPLDRLLGDEDEGSPSLLEFVAREYAGEGFDADKFARELRAKLERMRYPQPDPIASNALFSEILNRASVLSLLLAADTLRELWKSLVLKRVFERCRELRDKKQSGRGISLREHWRRVREAQRDTKTYKELDDKYGFEYTLSAYEKIAQRSVREMVEIRMSSFIGPRATLLSIHLPVQKWKSKLQTETSEPPSLPQWNLQLSHGLKISAYKLIFTRHWNGGFKPPRHIARALTTSFCASSPN